MGYDGCGVTNGIAGTIWAAGLGDQCSEVLLRVNALSELRAQRPLHVTAVGLSRGGIGALMLAKRLSDHPLASGADGSIRMRLSLCLYDPVPGNLIMTVRWIDPFFGRRTTAACATDVSRAPVHRVLALYPHEPLPDFAFHAPLLPTYPPGCDVDEDATLGCHQGALYPPRSVPSSMYPSCLLSRHRILTFLHACGVPLSGASAGETTELARACLSICEDALARNAPSFRAAHAANPDAAIVRRATGALLNSHHRQLLRQLRPEDPRIVAHQDEAIEAGANYMLTIVRPGSG